MTSKSEQGTGSVGASCQAQGPRTRPRHLPGLRAEPSPGGQEMGALSGGCEPFSALPVSNIIKAATDEGEGSSLGKPQKNMARSNHTVQNNSGGTAGQLRRKEVTEEEAER